MDLWHLPISSCKYFHYGSFNAPGYPCDVAECEAGKKYTEFTLVSPCKPVLAYILLPEITVFISL